MSQNNSAVVLAPNYQQAIAQTANHYNVMVAFVKAQMRSDVDYGVIPGTAKSSTQRMCYTST